MERNEAIVLAAILLVAAVLRVVSLNSGLWYDEVVTLVQSVRLAPAELLVTYGSLNNHVLYTWLAKGCVALFGEEPWALRLPAMLFGVASIAASWALVREAGFRWAALATAALLAVSFHHVWFSQNARGYTGLMLFTTLGGLALHRALTKDRVAHWVLYAGCFAAAMLIHLSAVFLLAAQGLTALGAGALRLKAEGVAGALRWLRGPLIGFGLGGAIVAAAFLPMLPGMTEAFSRVAGESAVEGVAAWKNPIWTIAESIRSFGVIAWAAPIALVFAAVGVWRMWRAAPFITAPFVLHIPLTLAVLDFVSMRVWPRYFFVDIGFLFAAVVIGAFVVAEFFAARLATQRRFGFGATALQAIGAASMIAVSAPLLSANYARPKQDFEGARSFVERQRADGDRVMTLGIASAYFNDYLGLDWPQPRSGEELRRAAELGRVWVVVAFPAHTRAYFGSEQAMLDRHFTLVKRFRGSLSGGDVLVFRAGAA